MRKRISIFIALFVIPVFAEAHNLHLIDENKNSDFAIYRTSSPNEKDMKELCSLGITEMVVLSGNADKYEGKYASACPTLKVVLNVEQSPTKPVTKEFLAWFDNWVQEAQAKGKKIAFRCNCGCHRTGRLAAYYQMRYQNITADDAIAIMKKHGKYMFMYPSLDDQVRAMSAFIQSKECKGKYCIKYESELNPSDYPEATHEE